MSEDELAKKQIEVYLKEYDSLRAEVLSRLTAQGQVFNFFVAVLGILLSIKAAKEVPLLDPDFIILGLPLIAAPFGFIFFDHEFMMFRNGFYIRNFLQPRLARLLENPDVLCAEVCGFNHLSRSARLVHTGVSLGRWSLFLLPTVVLAVRSANQNLELVGGVQVTMLVLGWLSSMVLLGAMIVAILEQVKWKNLATRP